MLNEKFLSQSKSDENDERYERSVKHDYCTPLNQVFAGGCCIIVMINVGIWAYIYYYHNGYKFFN